MTAREWAAEVLRRGREEHVYAADAFEDASGLSPQDRRLAQTLAFGTIRRRATLDAILRPYVQRPLFQLEPEVQDVLRLGAYQLAIMGGIPPHAAVHETVELVRFVRKPRAVGLVNGVLRRVAELVTDDVGDRLRADAVPLDGQQRFRRLNQPIFPDPYANPIGYLAIGFSWPRWLAERWIERFGFEECCRLGFWFNAPPSLWLRVNSLKTSRDEYRTQLDSRGIRSEPGDAAQSLQMGGGSVRELPGYDDGAFAIQDHASQLVAQALRPEPDWSILDLCAAPGGKTTHLAELMKNRGRIVACDIDASRLVTVTSLCQRLGISIVETALIPADGLPPAGTFDAALVDAPCSNSGVLGRRPEVRWRFQPKEFEYLVALQTRLLQAAVSRVKPGGVVVYSTCSIEPEENRGVVESVCRTVRGVTIESDATAVPGMPADGGYWARLHVGS
ncbi:MAG: 16S rRNA (cytosine(967)-C(5))-methyltransferase RsmB [Gemmataceae bacterium]